tara:strand:+ start:554 stop:730 length:177 start_codon:yes stop_codon:yes gene_type:complete
MKIIMNTSLQSWNLPFRTEKGVKTYYLMPNHTVQVPASYITENVIGYEKRKLISIKNA